MKALLNLQLVETPEEITFQSRYEQQIKQQFPEIHSFSMDNFSEASMVTYAQGLIKQSDRILILIESHSDNAKPNKLLKLLNTLVRERFSKGKVVLLGEHPVIEKMAKVLGENFDAGPTDKALEKILAELFA